MDKSSMEKVLSLLMDLIEDTTDEKLSQAIDSIFDKEAELRELSVSYDEDSQRYLFYYKDKVVGRAENHLTAMVFESYESLLGKDYPFIAHASRRFEQYPDDVSIVMFECFDRYVRSGEPFRTRYGTLSDRYSGLIPYLRHWKNFESYGDIEVFL